MSVKMAPESPLITVTSPSECTMKMAKPHHIELYMIVWSFADSAATTLFTWRHGGV